MNLMFERSDDLPVFSIVDLIGQPLADGTESEAEWMRQAARGASARACLWESRQALIVPRSYERAPRWREARNDLAAAGWPVLVRASGGGVVPQGPGVWNLSLVWRAADSLLTRPDAVYQVFCRDLTAAFARIGLHATAQPVDGSFCDGRFNLAVLDAKLVGTAQSWRRVEGMPLVLAHAVMVVDADPRALTERCNALEEAAGQQRRYRADAIMSVEEAWTRTHGGVKAPGDLGQQLRRAIAEQFSRR
jgi:lipoate-protein ligase A